MNIIKIIEQTVKLKSFKEAEKLYDIFINFTNYELLFYKTDLSNLGFPTLIKFELYNNKLSYNFDNIDYNYYIEVDNSIIRSCLLNEILNE